MNDEVTGVDSLDALGAEFAAAREFARVAAHAVALRLGVTPTLIRNIERGTTPCPPEIAAEVASLTQELLADGELPFRDYLNHEHARTQLTLADIAAQAGATRRQVREWESGNLLPTLEQANRLREFFPSVTDGQGAARKYARAQRRFADSTPPLTELGRLLVAARAQLGWEQTDLARRVRVGVTTVNNWERGRRQPQPAVAVRLRAALGEQWGSPDTPETFAAYFEPLFSAMTRAHEMRETSRLLRIGRHHPTELGRLLANALWKLRWTRDDLITQAKVSAGTLQSWALGKTLPRPESVNRLRVAFGEHWGEPDTPNTLAAYFAQRGNASGQTDQAPTTELGRLLVAARRQLGWEHAELGERVGVGSAAVRDWERGIRIPKPGVVLRLSAALGSHWGSPEEAGTLAAYFETLRSERATPGRRRRARPEEPPTTELGRLLAHALWTRKWTREDLASNANVTVTQLKSWERGKTKPRSDCISRLRAALGDNWGAEDVPGTLAAYFAPDAPPPPAPRLVKPEPINELGRLLFRARQTRNWSQWQLASAAKLSITSIGLWEAGKGHPRGSSVARLQSALQDLWGTPDAPDTLAAYFAMRVVAPLKSERVRVVRVEATPTTELGRLLVGARERLGWSRQQFADAINMSEQSVNLWERGKAHPRRDLIPRLQSAVGEGWGTPDEPNTLAGYFAKRTAATAPKAVRVKPVRIEPPPTTELGRLLVGAREKLGWSRQHLADMSNLHVRPLTLWEKGERAPGP